MSSITISSIVALLSQPHVYTVIAAMSSIIVGFEVAVIVERKLKNDENTFIIYR